MALEISEPLLLLKKPFQDGVKVFFIF